MHIWKQFKKNWLHGYLNQLRNLQKLENLLVHRTRNVNFPPLCNGVSGKIAFEIYWPLVKSTMTGYRLKEKLFGFLRRCCCRCWLSLLLFLVALLQVEKIKEVFINRYTSIRWFNAVCTVFLCSKGPYFDLIGFRSVLTFVRLIGIWSRSEILAWLQLWSLGPNKLQGVGICPLINHLPIIFSPKLIWIDWSSPKIGLDFRK